MLQALALGLALIRPPSLRPRGARPCMTHSQDRPESQTLYQPPNVAGYDEAFGSPASWSSCTDAAGPLLWGSYIVGQLPHLRGALEQCLNDGEELATRLAEYDAELQQATGYLRPSAKQKVRLALEVALLAHHGQKRRSGEPYIIHPVAVAVILGGTEMDRDAICAGLLHDTVEDTVLGFADLELLFGATVGRLVEGETKVSKLPKMASQMDTSSNPADEQAEHLLTTTTYYIDYRLLTTYHLPPTAHGAGGEPALDVLTLTLALTLTRRRTCARCS